MPKNKGAGGKNRRRGKTDPVKPKELVLKQEREGCLLVDKNLDISLYIYIYFIVKTYIIIYFCISLNHSF